MLQSVRTVMIRQVKYVVHDNYSSTKINEQKDPCKSLSEVHSNTWKNYNIEHVQKCSSTKMKAIFLTAVSFFFFPPRTVLAVPRPQQGQLHIYITILFNAALTLMYRQPEKRFSFNVTFHVNIRQLTKSITFLNHASDSNFVVSRCNFQLFKRLSCK